MARRSRALVAAAGSLLLLLVLLVSCGPPETDPDALRADDGSPLYRDGVYATALSDTGPEGWRPFLELNVRAGIIVNLCFDAVNAKGERLSQDEGYTESYRLQTGIVIATTLDALHDEMLDTQRLPVRAEEGAFGWTGYFQALAERTLESAQSGATVESTGIASVAAAGPYTASDSPDELGWAGSLTVTYGEDGVATADYREIRLQPDGSTVQKRDDATYQERFRKASGTGTEETAGALQENLVKSGVAGIDAITGATLTTNRFVELAQRIDRERVAAPLPKRLCR